jgi:hypothetical protein
MTTRELLELAAKAAGYGAGHYEDGSWLETRYGYTAALYLDCDDFDGYWNPLEHDGDALRLAAKLQIDTQFHVTHVYTSQWVTGLKVAARSEAFADHDGDQCAATRHAIVRAAAEIARAQTQ